MTHWIDDVKFDEQGLIPVIAQDHKTGRVLMFAWMNREALEQTAKTGQAVYYSRSRQKLWPKGESSGHTQKIHEIQLDCDADVILLKIDQIGDIACHTGRQSCFFRKLTPQGWETAEPIIKDPQEIYGSTALTEDHSSASSLNSGSQDVLKTLGNLILARKQAASDKSYVASLYQKGLNKILEKIGEEATETIIAAKDAQFDQSQLEHVIYETADLWFHTLVMLGHYDLTPNVILNELARRFGLSGLEEKASRQASS